MEYLSETEQLNQRAAQIQQPEKQEKKGREQVGALTFDSPVNEFGDIKKLL